MTHSKLAQYRFHLEQPVDDDTKHTWLFFHPQILQKLIQECRIMPNIFSDHSALILTICFDEETAPRGPGYWRFNNSLLSDNEYVALLRSKIPEFVEKYKEVEDKGLFWEMVKMEIRGLTVRFSKLKATF